MGFYATEPVCECRKRRGTIVTHTSAKTRVSGFCKHAASRSRLCSSQSTSLQRVTEPDPPETASGVPYYGYRFYSANLAGWLSRDPLGDQAFLLQALKGRSRQEKNWLRKASRSPIYLYVSNDPVNAIDPLGLRSAKETACIFCVCGVDFGPIGPINLAKLNSVVKGAIDDANKRFPVDEPEQNAYRHCIGSCRSMRAVGPKCALGAQWCHEKYGGGSATDTAADKHNNKTGNGLALKWGSCDDLCMEAMQNGDLDCKGRPCDPNKADF